MNTNEIANQILAETHLKKRQFSKTAKKETGLKGWIKENKLPLALSAVGIAAIVGTMAIVGKGPAKYSMEWISRLSAEEWEIERQKVQDIYRNPQYDNFFRERQRELLNLFDKVKSAKDWAGDSPRTPTYHREHGRNLYKSE